MDVNMIIEMVLKAAALAMGIASTVLGFFPKEVDLKTHISMLGIGLTALAIAALI